MTSNSQEVKKFRQAKKRLNYSNRFWSGWSKNLWKAIRKPL